MSLEKMKPVDIVIPWVDGADPAWRRERDEYLGKNGRRPGALSSAGAEVSSDIAFSENSAMDLSEARIRDEGTLKYLLRSIERFMPWVRSVCFVTWGHLPEWMNRQAEGLRIINHRDYIPAEYLPTFSSHPIELNMHRIPELAERFIYFNDDMLVLRPCSEKDFFLNGLPRDYAVETALIGRRFRSIAGVSLSNMEIINAHFSKRNVQKKHLGKWINIRYGKAQLKTLMLMAWPWFSDLSYHHTANAYLKSTFEEVWEAAGKELDEVCRHRFRQMNDVNQWLMRDWQLVTGKFVPKGTKDGKNFNICSEMKGIQKAIQETKYRIICMNDVNYEEAEDYDRLKEELQMMLEDFLPQKSRFEI